jgi:hypothetical protein
MTFQSPEYFLLIPAFALIGWFWKKLRLHSPLRAILIIIMIHAWPTWTDCC